MGKSIELKYGETVCRLKVPESAEILEVKDPGFDVDKNRFKQEVKEALPLRADKLESVAVVVADKTRRCGYDRYLPALAEALESGGVSRKAVTFYIAYGTHKIQTENESLDVYGEIYKAYPFVHHDCCDETLFEYCGRTRRGTDVHIRKDILASDLIITIGALSHHYFAGYGGGRKLLFPGLGKAADIYHNHSLFLDANEKRLSDGCRPGNIEGNPLAEDLKEVDDHLKIPRISIHGILDAKARLRRLIVADAWDGFMEGCGDLDRLYKTGSKRRFSLVVASCGGHPKDINFIQAHKALNNAAMFVKDGGYLVLMAECPDGIGSDTFLPYFECGRFEWAFEAIHRDYRGNGGTALSMMTKTQRINIFLKTGLDDTICATMGVKKIENFEIEELIKKYGKKMACIRHGGLLIR